MMEIEQVLELLPLRISSPNATDKSENCWLETGRIMGGVDGDRQKVDWYACYRDWFTKEQVYNCLSVDGTLKDALTQLYEKINDHGNKTAPSV